MNKLYSDMTPEVGLHVGEKSFLITPTPVYDRLPSEIIFPMG
jgi:hypothetical protein